MRITWRPTVRACGTLASKMPARRLRPVFSQATDVGWRAACGSARRRTRPSRETRTTDPGTPLWALPCLGESDQRAVRGEARARHDGREAGQLPFAPSGEGCDEESDDRSSARRRRRNPTSVPSGDTSPASAPLKRRRSSPPTTGTLQIEGPSFSSVRVKRIDWPSGKNLGSVSAGPFVRAVSPSPRICFSQMRDRPAAARRERDELAVGRGRGRGVGSRSGSARGGPPGAVPGARRAWP